MALEAEGEPMPLKRFKPGLAYPWNAILAELAGFGYREVKKGALDVHEDPLLPVFVFPTEGHPGYTNGLDASKRRLVMQVNPDDIRMNDRLRASVAGRELGLFFRPQRQLDFTF